jgi:hypothetical protein
MVVLVTVTSWAQAVAAASIASRAVRECGLMVGLQAQSAAGLRPERPWIA